MKEYSLKEKQDKTFDDPNLHGWLCKHYAKKVVRADMENKR